jgi:hypothetical protein
MARMMLPRLVCAVAIVGIGIGSWRTWTPEPTYAQSPERACAQSRVNVKGTNGAVVTVDATAGGIIVADSNPSRCFLWINNDTVNPMRCAPSTGPYALVVSATVGFLWPVSPAPILGWAAAEQWKCFRTTGVSATVSTMEGLP